MKRAEITGPGAPLKVASYPKPDAPAKGILLQMKYSGICHTDLHLINDKINLGGGKFWRHRDVLGDKFVGVVPGHEIFGIVEKLGSGVPADCGIKEGDKVAVYPWRGCRACEFCDIDLHNMCENNKGTTTDLGKGNENGGGYSNYLAVPEVELCVKVPDSIPGQVACTLPCSALTTYNALDKTTESVNLGVKMRKVGYIFIIGAGGLGMWCIILARMLYRGKNVKIIVADVGEDKLNAAKSVGADETVLFPKDADTDDLVALVTQNGKRKVDTSIDLVGAHQTQKVAFFSLHNGGTLIPVGLAGGELVLPIPNIISKTIGIRGSRTGSVNQLRELVDLVQKEKDMPALPCELFDLDDVNDALDRLRKGQINGRAIFKF